MYFNYDIIFFMTDHQTESNSPEMDISNTTVTINENDCELKTCWLADTPGVIALSLWDAQIELVEAGKSYSFTNLATRKFCDNISLTTTRTSTFTPILKKIYQNLLQLMTYKHLRPHYTQFPRRSRVQQ